MRERARHRAIWVSMPITRPDRRACLPSSPISVVHPAAPGALTGDLCRRLVGFLAHLADPGSGVADDTGWSASGSPGCWPGPGRWPRSANGRGCAGPGPGRARDPPRPADRRLHALAEATVRRVLARVDPDALDGRPPPPRRPHRGGAVDGTTLPGSGHHGRSPVHLLAAMGHTAGVVLAQTEVATPPTRSPGSGRCWSGWTAPTPSSPPMAAHPARARRLAGHPQARRLAAGRQAQPAHPRPAAPRPAVAPAPVADTTRDRGHGRVETRRPKVTTVAGLDVPHAAQACGSPGEPGRLPATADAPSRWMPSPASPPPRPAPPASPWRSCGATATATSPPGCAATPATRPACYPCSAAAALSQALGQRITSGGGWEPGAFQAGLLRTEFAKAATGRGDAPGLGDQHRPPRPARALPGARRRHRPGARGTPRHLGFGAVGAG